MRMYLYSYIFRDTKIVMSVLVCIHTCTCTDVHTYLHTHTHSETEWMLGTCHIPSVSLTGLHPAVYSGRRRGECACGAPRAVVLTPVLSACKKQPCTCFQHPVFLPPFQRRGVMLPDFQNEVLIREALLFLFPCKYVGQEVILCLPRN